MSFKKTLIFAIILVCIGGFYYFFEIKRAPEKQKEEEEAAKVFHFAQEDVKKFTISNNDGKVTCQLKGDKWRVTAPIKTEGDKAIIDGFIRSLHNLDSSLIVEEKPEDLQKYGLDNPFVTVTFSVKGKSHTILVGNEDPTGSGAYAKLGGEQKVLLIDSYMRNSLNQNLFNLRDKSVITFDLDEVKQFSLQLDEISVKARRRGEQEWMLSKPIKDKGDKDKIAEVLNKFRNAKVKEFSDAKPENLELYGLEKSHAKLTVWLGKEKALKTLLIGKKEEEKKGYYAKLQETDNLFLVEESLLKDIPSDTFSWRDKRLLTFKRGNIERILLSFNKETTEIKKKKKDAWRMTQPLKVDADRWEISNLLSDLEFTKGIRFIDPPLKEDSFYGFDNPTLKLSLWLKGSNKPISIVVGKEKGDEKEYYVRTARKQSVTLVKGEALEKLKKTSFDLRDKEILGFQFDKLENITLKFPDQEVVVGKSRNKWKVKKPRKLKRKKDKEAEDLVWSLDSVQMKKITAESAKDLKPYGLDKPRVEIEVKLKDKETPQILLIGKKVKDVEEVFAKIKSKPAIYQISASVWKDIENLIKEEEDE